MNYDRERERRLYTSTKPHLRPGYVGWECIGLGLVSRYMRWQDAWRGWVELARGRELLR